MFSAILGNSSVRDRFPFAANRLSFRVRLGLLILSLCLQRDSLIYNQITAKTRQNVQKKHKRVLADPAALRSVRQRTRYPLCVLR